MLSLSLPVEIYLSTAPADMRKSFDGLFALAVEHLGRDPFSGGVFVFVNRRRDRMKLLYWDADGLAVWAKRLEAGSFQVPRVAAGAERDAVGHRVDAPAAWHRPGERAAAATLSRKRVRRACAKAPEGSRSHFRRTKMGDSPPRKRFFRKQRTKRRLVASYRA